MVRATRRHARFTGFTGVRHGPNEDAFPLIDVNETFAEVVAYDRRVFAGMVSMLDQAVANITEGGDLASLCLALVFFWRARCNGQGKVTDDIGRQHPES